MFDKQFDFLLALNQGKMYIRMLSLGLSDCTECRVLGLKVADRFPFLTAYMLPGALLGVIPEAQSQK